VTRPIYTKVRNPVILGLIELQKQEAKKKPKPEPEAEPEPVKGKRAAAKKGGRK
jgi:hypothetical protein